MAKGKDRPTAPTATSKSAATSRSPTAKPMQAKGPSRTAPDASATRPGDGQSRGNTAAKLSNEDVYKLIQESPGLGVSEIAERSGLGERLRQLSD